jgi:plastocyanin
MNVLVKAWLRASLLVGLLSLSMRGAAANAADLTVDIRGPGGAPVADAVVYAEPVFAEGKSPVVPAPAVNLRATIDQVNKEFVPRVSVVRAGTQVFFPNSDNIRHSIYSFSPAKTFTTKLYSGREAAPVSFDKTGMVVLGCNIHDKMVAWVVIVDTPWFAKSGADGMATLRALPPGDYRLTAAAPSSPLTTRAVNLRIDTETPRQLLVLEAS